VAALEDDAEEDAGGAAAGVEVVVADVVVGVVEVDDEVAGDGELPDVIGAVAAIDGEDETATDAGSLDAAVVCVEDELPPP